MKEFAAAEWDRARRALASAELLVEADPDSAASRAYYAGFHALAALFALRGQTFSKHSAVRAALHRDLIHTGALATAIGRDYDFLMDLRETADYGGVAQVPVESAKLAVEKAEGFLAAMGRICPDLGGPHSDP